MSICNTVYIHLAGCKVRVWSCLGSSPIHSLDKHQEDPVFGFFWEFLRALDRWLDNTKYCARPETWRSTLTKSFFFLLFLLSVILFPVVLAASFLLLPFLCYFGILSLFHSVSFHAFSFCSIIVVMILHLCNSEASQQKFEAWRNRLSQVQHGAVPPNICWWRRTDFCQWSRGQLLSVSYPEGKLDTRCIRLLLGMNYTEREIT